MVTRIHSRRTSHLYITEWRKDRGLSLEALGGRIVTMANPHGVGKGTMQRWETDQNRLDPEKIEAIAAALDLTPPDLWSPPGRKSIDGMLASEPDDFQERIADLVASMIRRAS